MGDSRKSAEPDDAGAEAETGARAETGGGTEAGAHARPAEPEEEAELRISQWLRNGEGETLGMASRVDEQKAYWYAVEIGRQAREGASDEGFPESKELQVAETAFVAVEVVSPLVVGGSEQRWVEYRRGKGFGAQFFQLHVQGKTGRHPLTVSLVHGNRVVYRHEWIIQVGKREQDRAAKREVTATTAD